MPFVYFLQAESGPIKIGFSLNVEERFRDLQQTHFERLRLIGYCEGSLELETKLKLAARKSRIRGEWFRPTSKVASIIRAALPPDVEIYETPKSLRGSCIEKVSDVKLFLVKINGRITKEVFVNRRYIYPRTKGQPAPEEQRRIQAEATATHIANLAELRRARMRGEI